MLTWGYSEYILASYPQKQLKYTKQRNRLGNNFPNWNFSIEHKEPQAVMLSYMSFIIYMYLLTKLKGYNEFNDTSRF